MISNALMMGLISEQNIRDAIITARGDVFLTAAYLSCTPREIDRYIRASEGLQAFVGSIAVVKKDANYDRMSADQFREELEQLTRAYRVEAIEVIRELASMPFDSAAMADVKLKAAIELRGANTDAPINNSHSQVLAELNDRYQQSAPRIRSIRIAQIDYNEGPDRPTL